MKNKLFIILLGAVFAIISCNDDFLDFPNPNAFDANTYYTDSVTCQRSVNAIYTIMLHQGMFSRDWYFNFDLLANEAGPLTPLQGQIAELPRGVYDASNSALRPTWDRLYRMILRANYAIDVNTKWEPATPEGIALKGRYIGEAEFFLGFAYYHLGSLWGAVPLRKSFQETGEQLNCPRSPVADVFAFAEENLIAAAEALPPVYDDFDNGRATKWAAKAFLGKLYIMQGEWDKAAPIFQDIIQNGGYEMENGSDGFANQFLEVNRNSPETIFDCKFAWYGWGEGNAYHMFDGTELWGGKGATSGRAMEYGFWDWGNVNITTSAVSKFKYNINSVTDYVDPRAFNTFYGDGGFGGDMDCAKGPYPFDTPVTYPGDASPTAPKGYRWKKYQQYETKISEGEPSSQISTVITRLADIKLLYAECLIQGNNLPGALTQINEVRARSGAVEYLSLGNQSDAMNILKREREIELCGEQQRWFDLIRWDINGKIFDFVAILNGEKAAQGESANFTEKNLLLPIPQVEKDVNKLCEVPNGWN
jgi:starch-binding outer membrane protein, SusD/RagB family